MEPEIARRCSDCGAAVRGAAAFCPECGQPLKARAADVDSAVEVAEMPARRKVEGGTDTPPPALTTQPSSVAASAASVAPAQEIPSPNAASEERPRVVATTTPLTPETEERSRRQRMTTAARGAVEGKIAPRVEKLRQASSVMLEEASSDPGLRFVLIAIAIFILSGLLFLLNHLLG